MEKILPAINVTPFALMVAGVLLLRAVGVLFSVR
jgi:hypothetical protein